MKVKHESDVKQEKVTMANSKGTYIQWLINKQEGLHFSLRKFELKEFGEIGLHSHPEEHEIYILSGKGEVYNEKGLTEIVQSGNVIFVPPNEKHGYKNIGQGTFSFLCVIPILEKIPDST